MFKKILVAVCFFAFLASTSAQKAPVTKMYAYSQATLPGKKPSGNRTDPDLKKESFRLFVSVTGKEVINITGVWIKEEYYRFTVSSKLKTPIKMGQPDDGIILVPKTNNKVLEIMLKGKQEPAPRPGTKLGTLMKMNAVVISYSWKGKQYFITTKTIKELPPFIAM